MVETVLRAENLVLNYGSQTVVDQVSFELKRGRILALIGPNGAGKSSIMRILAALVKPERGVIYLNEKLLSDVHTIHKSAGFFIETPDFYKNLTAVQNLSLLQKVRVKKQSVSFLLEMVGLSGAAHKKLRKYSKGMKQRLGIAQAMIGDPEIIILDEPFHGLDPEVKLFLMQLIKKLAHEKNKAILVSSHLLSDLELIADDFLLLNSGKKHLSGRLADYGQDKQKVTFWFDSELRDHKTRNLEFGQIQMNNKCCWEAELTKVQTTTLLKQMVDMEMMPYEIDREDLLYSKYMEIAE